ncbi:MAG: nucleotidyltransferase family protein [Pyrinomonadaceae bacterium]
MTEIKNNVGIIILAAGSSSRLGQPKQLLRFEEKTILRRSVESAQKSKCFPQIVVLGANFEKISVEIKDLNCELVFNADWQTGMSSSVKTGVEKMLEIAPNISALILALCDQPFVQSTHFDQLIRKYVETKKPIVAGFYNENFGVPALFAKELFSDLLNLEGDKGAKEIILNNPDFVEKLYLPEAEIDIDTKEDFKRLKTGKLKNR